MNNYVEVLKKYAMFEGRAGRKEYWMFTLVNVLIIIGYNLFAAIPGLAFIQIIGIVYLFAILVPSLAVYVRRLHDTNHSAWWILLALIPIVGTIILLIFLVTDSQAGDNRFGSNPKGAPVPQAPQGQIASQ